MVEFDILFGSGIDRYGCLIDAAELCGVIERRGSWYYRNDIKMAQGRQGAIESLKLSGESLVQEIQYKVKEVMANKQQLLLTGTSTAVSEITNVGVLATAGSGVDEGFDDSGVINEEGF